MTARSVRSRIREEFITESEVKTWTIKIHFVLKLKIVAETFLMLLEQFSVLKDQLRFPTNIWE